MTTILHFADLKKKGEKISMVTCYDYTSARIVAQTAIDAILVGDSAAMTMHGYKDTIPATMEMMCWHTSAVRRGAPEKFIVADLPFLSFRKSLSKNVTAAQQLMQAGAAALKIECATGNLKLIRHLTESGIPIMGHLGLTMQSLHMLGGCRIQGKTEEAAKRIKDDALLMQEAGCFSLVLECLPTSLAREITESLLIPTIGIGAGPHTDGQILVFQDLLGLNIDFKAKFVKTFMDGHAHIKQSLDTYTQAVKSGDFPQHEHCYGN